MMCQRRFFPKIWLRLCAGGLFFALNAAAAAGVEDADTAAVNAASAEMKAEDAKTAQGHQLRGVPVEIRGKLSISPMQASENHNSPYSLPPNFLRTSRQDLELNLRAAGFNTQAVFRQELAHDTPPQYSAVLNQLYYDGQTSPQVGWTLGKKSMPWGVGFGFRPLDVIQRENLRAINPPPLEGVYLGALDYFTATDAWSLIASSHVDRDNDASSRNPGVALRWYRLMEGDDLYGVVRFSEDRKLEAGVGMTHVIGDEWSLHGAALYQRRTWRNNPLIPASDKGPSAKVVLGAVWTGTSGVSVLTEAWYDGDAYRKNEWQTLNDLVRQQNNSGLPAPNGSTAATFSQIFLSPNLVRDNALVRLSYDDKNHFKPYIELLVTPSDGGRVFTSAAKWEVNRHVFELGLRAYGGKSNSAYHTAPIRHVVWAGWRWAIF